MVDRKFRNVEDYYLSEIYRLERRVELLHVLYAVLIVLMLGVVAYQFFTFHKVVNGGFAGLEDSGRLINLSDFEAAELSGEEFEHVTQIMSDVNPLYLSDQLPVVFVHNITPYCDSCGGVNGFEGQIFVKYVENDFFLRRTVCHELLHSYVRPSRDRSPFEDVNHAVVFALAQQLVCFNDEGNEYVT